MKPRWDCYSESDRQRLKRWTIEQLALPWVLPKADRQRLLPAVLRGLTDEQYHEMRKTLDPNVAIWFASTKETHERLVRYRHARKATEALDKLIGDDHKLRALVLDKLRQRGRGRKKGERRPNDWTSDERHELEAALKNVERIRQVWRINFGRVNRSEPPTAMEIAAGMYGFDEDDLVRFKKSSS
jgi:hypothetical protein